MQKATKTSEILFLNGHIGHTKVHPLVTEYLYGIRDKSAIFNSELTVNHLNQSLCFIFYVIKNKGNILFVNSNPRYSALIKKTALICNQNLIDKKWIGGTLTNWKNVSKSIQNLKKFEERFKPFIYKHKVSFSLYEKTKQQFEGFQLANETKKPDVIISLNSYNNEILLKEAALLNIPVISIIDSDIDPSNIMYPIPANEQSITFIYYFLNLVTKTIKLAQQ